MTGKAAENRSISVIALKHITDHKVDELIFIRKVITESGSTYNCIVAQLFDCDLFKAFRLEKLGKSACQRCICFLYP